MALPYELACQRFLSEASERLASSLDFRAIAREAADLIVPRHAEWCAIHLHEIDDATPAFTWTSPDAERSPEPTNPPLLEAVERTGQPQEVALDAGARSIVEAFGDAHLDRLSAIGVRAVAAVPLVARGRTLGALALAFGRGRPTRAVPPLVLVEDFAHRLALALDNALLYRAAREAVRMRDDVLAVVSHDLRAPLATILLRAEQLTEYPCLRKTAAMIKQATQLMNRLIGDLLDASAIDAGQLALDRAPQVIADVIEEAADLFRMQADAREIALVVEPGPRDVQVIADRDRLVQVLTNLLANALRYTPRRGSVRLAAVPEDATVRLEVEDTGCGIPDEQVPHLFDRFWRAHPHRQGAGLGLYIARGIVAAHGGTIGVDTALGRGSRFHVALPRAA